MTGRGAAGRQRPTDQADQQTGHQAKRDKSQQQKRTQTEEKRSSNGKQNRAGGCPHHPTGPAEGVDQKK